VTSNHFYESYEVIKFWRRKNCIVERENAFFQSSPVDEYHLPQMNFEKDLSVGHKQQNHKNIVNFKIRVCICRTLSWPKDSGAKNSKSSLTSVSRLDYRQSDHKRRIFTFHIWNMESIGFTCKKKLWLI
jgi:hypothetical protein